MTPTKQYYDLQEAMQRLGVSKTTFYEYVNDGRIQKRLPLGKQRGAFFLAKDVDSLAAALKGFVKLYGDDKEKTTFRAARPEDAQDMYELGERIMSRSGGYSIPAESLIKFLSLPNSEVGHVLIRDEKIIGYFTVLPLRHETTMQIMQKKIRVREVNPKELAQFEPDEPIDIFVWEVMSENKHIGQYLIGAMLTFFHSLGKRGVDIQGVYAIATSREGIELSRRIGMTVMNLPEVIQPNWMPYEWKIQEQKNWLNKNYIQALKSYRKRMEHLHNQEEVPTAFKDNGALERITPPGKKQGVYRRSQVDQLARDLKTFIVTRQRHPSIFMKMTTREEILESAKISDAIFGGHIDVDRQLAWLKRNPDIGYVVKSEGKVVGYAIILPLKPEKIAKLMREEEHTINLEPEEIQVFEPGIPLHLYGGAIGVLPDISLAEKRTYGSRLIGGLIDALIDLGKRGVVFETFTARSTKPDGVRLLRNVGFTQIPSITEKKDFVLNVEMSGAREIMQYKLALKEYQLRNSIHEEKADIKTDIKTERKPRTMGDASRQTTRKQKSPTRSRSHSTQMP